MLYGTRCHKLWKLDSFRIGLTMEKEQSFRVYLRDHSSASQIDKAHYDLVVNLEGISLHDVSTRALVLMWPFNHIRGYGTREGRFEFEVGRGSKTGEGKFEMDAERPRDIFKKAKGTMEFLMTKGAGIKRGQSVNPPQECGPRYTPMVRSGTGSGLYTQLSPAVKGKSAANAMKTLDDDDYLTAVHKDG